MVWVNTSQLQPRQFTCGFCGHLVASRDGFFNKEGGGNIAIYICPNCDKPSYFAGNDEQVPGVAPGKEIDDIPQDLLKIYNEARHCISVNAYTASVLACRKLLMNIAVQKSAKKGQSFIYYVEYLADNNYVPRDGKGWVDHIRTKGNEATHEIPAIEKKDAEELISFAEMLLKFIFEFPARIPSK